jgi:hypothetical protein
MSVNEMITAHRIFYNMHELFFRCPSVALLPSILMLCTQDGSLNDATSHCKQILLHSDRRYVSLDDIAEKLVSTRIVCH